MGLRRVSNERLKKGRADVLLLLSPPTLQIWLASMPMVQPPRLHEGDKRRSEAPLIRAQEIIRLVGVKHTGPTPQMMPPGPGAFGERKKLCVVLPSRRDLGGPELAGKTSFCEMMGRIVRRIRFQSLLMEIGNDRLDVEGEFVAAAGRVEIPIRLEGHADKRGDGVGKLFGELRGLIVASSDVATSAAGSL